MNVLKYLTNCTVMSTVRQEDDEKGWLAARSRGIGGSDVGPICGVSPFSSARQVYLNKTGQYTDALKPGAAAQERMHFGHLLEPIVANEFALRTGKKLVTADATLQHKDYPWALANVDRFIVDDEGRPIGVLECKTSSEYMNDEWESGEILLTYLYQLNWYLWITGLNYGAFACLVGGNKFYYYEVYRNDELLNETIIPEAEKFWHENVLGLKEPELQASDSEFVKDSYTEVIKNSETFFDDDVTNDIAQTVVDCKARIKELEMILEEAQNKLKDRLKENEIGYCKDFVVKWSPRSRTTVDTKLLKQNFPEVYEQCQSTTSYRVMTVKGA